MLPNAPPNSMVTELNSSGISSDNFRQLNESLAKRAEDLDDKEESVDTTSGHHHDSRLETSDTGAVVDNNRDNNGNSRNENQLEYTQHSVTPTLEVNVFRDPNTSPGVGLVAAGMMDVRAREREKAGQADQ